MCLTHLYFTQGFGDRNFSTRRLASVKYEVGLFSETIRLGGVKY